MDTNDRSSKVTRIDFNCDSASSEQIVAVENNLYQEIDKLLLCVDESIDILASIKSNDFTETSFSYITSLKSMREVLMSEQNIIESNKKIRKIRRNILTCDVRSSPSLIERKATLLSVNLPRGLVPNRKYSI